MSLSGKYDKLHYSSLTKKQLPEILILGWPKDRFQAIVAMDGQDESILDIGCETVTCYISFLILYMASFNNRAMNSLYFQAQ